MTTTTTRRPTPAQDRKAAIESEYAPLYAAAGLTDLAVESIKNLVLATQEKATKQLTEWQGSFAGLQSKGSEQAKHAGEFVRALPEQVKALPEQLKTLPETTKARIEELDKQRKEFLAEATVTYGDLAGRGKKVIDDSVIAVRDSLHDLVPAPGGGWYERRRIDLRLLAAHDAVIVARGQPASMQIDSLRGTVSDPPVPVRQARGTITWTSDSLMLDLPQVALPASTGSARGTIAWNMPGPVRMDVTIRADAGLSDLGWIWDALPSEGRGRAVVRMRTLANPDDVDYALDSLEVQSAGSAVRGRVSVTVRPADLLLHRVDLAFVPLRTDLARRLSAGALPDSVRGTITGRLVAEAGGPLTAFRIDRLDAQFADAAVRGLDGRAATSLLRLRGEIGLGVAPRARNLIIDTVSVDLATVRRLVAEARDLDGVVAGRAQIAEAQGDAFVLREAALAWTDAEGNRSVVRGEGRARFGSNVSTVQGTLALEPLSMRALARIDTTVPSRALLAGTLSVQGRTDSLAWEARVRPVAGADSVGGVVSAKGLASVTDARWRVQADATLADVDARAWLARDDVPSSRVGGTVQVAATASRDTSVRDLEARVGATLQQEAGAQYPAATLVASGQLDARRLQVDSALLTMGGVVAEARGGLARDSIAQAARLRVSATDSAVRVDTLTVSVRSDSLDAVRADLRRVAAMLAPLDTALATTVRDLAADTLTGDASVSGYLTGSLARLDATLAAGGRALQVGAVHVGRLFGSVQARDVTGKTAFEGAASLDDVTGVGAVRLQGVAFRMSQASPDSGVLVLDVSTVANAHLGARGRYQAAGARTVVTLDSVRLAYDDEEWTAPRPIGIERDSAMLRIAPSELRSTRGGVLALEADLPPRGPVRAALQVARFPVGEVAALVSDVTPFNGLLTGEVQMQGTRAAPAITWTIEADSLGLEGWRLPRITSTGDYADRRLVAMAELLDAAGGALRATAQVPIDLALQRVEKRQLSDVLEGELVADSLRLDALPIAVTGVSRPRGVLAGRVALSGTFDRPAANGEVRLEGFGARLDDLGVEPSDGRAVLRAKGDSLFVEGLYLRSGGMRDTLGVNGVVVLPPKEKGRIALDVTASNFQAARQRDGTDLDVSGRVRVEGALDRPAVRGNIAIPRANLVIDPLGARSALDLTSATARELLGVDEVPVAESAAQTLANLGRFITVDNGRVDLGTDVWVQTPEARVKLSGGLGVTMSGEKLALQGEIAADRGQYRLDLGVVNRSFTVDSGRVRFFGNDALPPTVDITATNVVRVAGGSEIPVRVHIGGTYDKPILTLTSTDPLYASAPESEIISLLIFGAPTFALDGQSQSTVRAVTGVLLPTVGGAVEGALQRLLPVFNTVQVTTAGSQTSGDLSAASLLNNLSISAGKQIGERTFLRLNTGICRGAGQAAARGASIWGGVAAEYRLGRNWWAQVGVDPGSTPCSRPSGDAFPRLQFGFDLFKEWIF
ncbi:MAG: translocation/assembly module TamB [Gemmatimonadetes bacterium]|nr:translocation/assembly module TamB [Gemmatimonadota bacterium]